jgi:hypothetical protein
VNAPAELREALEPLGDRALLDAFRALRYETMDGPGDAARYTLRELADPHRSLDYEARRHERVLDTLTNNLSIAA